MLDDPKNLLDQEPGEALPFTMDLDISPSRVSPLAPHYARN